MARKRRGGGADHKGRSSNTDRFVRLGHNLLTSNAYRALTPNARSLLVELAMLDNGSNNGSLYLSVRDAAARMGVADLTAASRAFDELMALGFIDLAQDAHFAVKAAEASRARCWRLTWLPGPGRKAATWEFLAREPAPQTPARRRMERGLRALKNYRKAKDQGKMPVLDSDTLAKIRPELATVAVAKSDTLNQANGGLAPKDCIRDSATHTAIPGGREPQIDWIAWWQPDWTPSFRSFVFFAYLSRREVRMCA